MKCPKCDYKNEEEYKFCYNCGTKLEPTVIDYRLMRRNGRIFTVALALMVTFLTTGAIYVLGLDGTGKSVNVNAANVLKKETKLDKVICSKTDLFLDEVEIEYNSTVKRISKLYVINASKLNDNEEAKIRKEFEKLKNDTLSNKTKPGFSYSIENSFGEDIKLAIRYIVDVQKAEQDLKDLVSYRASVSEMVNVLETQGYECN